MGPSSPPMRVPTQEVGVPTYQYACKESACGHRFEAVQSFSDDPLTSCSTCEAPVQRVFHPVAVHFKGSGFYNTDYGTSKRKRELEKSASEGADKHDAKRAAEKKSSSSDSKPASSSSKKD